MRKKIVIFINCTYKIIKKIGYTHKFIFNFIVEFETINN